MIFNKEAIYLKIFTWSYELIPPVVFAHLPSCLDGVQFPFTWLLLCLLLNQYIYNNLITHLHLFVPIWLAIFTVCYIYKGWGLSHGNYSYLARLIDHERTWI